MKITLWNKIVAGTKFMFCGFESATDYSLNLLNKYIGSGDIAERVQEARKYIGDIIGFLTKYQEFCPMKWLDDYNALICVLNTAYDALSDGKITPEEVYKAIADAKMAIAEWMKN